MKKNRITSRLVKMHKYANDDNTIKEVVIEHIKISQPLAKKLLIAFKEFEELKDDMENFQLPEIYLEDKDSLINNCIEDGSPYAQFCTDGEAEATYEKLSSLCYKIAMISNQLSDNLILQNEYY